MKNDETMQVKEQTGKGKNYNQIRAQNHIKRFFCPSVNKMKEGQTGHGRPQLIHNPSEKIYHVRTHSNINNNSGTKLYASGVPMLAQ